MKVPKTAHVERTQHFDVDVALLAAQYAREYAECLEDHGEDGWREFVQECVQNGLVEDGEEDWWVTGRDVAGSYPIPLSERDALHLKPEDSPANSGAA